MSRTFLCGDKPASPAQRELYAFAHEQIETNVALLRPGVGFREFNEASWKMPERFIAHRYMSLVHGAGLCGELWQRGDERFVVRGPGECIHHAPRVPHAMKTGSEPLLALYVWRGGDLAEKSTLRRQSSKH